MLSSSPTPRQESSPSKSKLATSLQTIVTSNQERVFLSQGTRNLAEVIHELLVAEETSDQAINELLKSLAQRYLQELEALARHNIYTLAFTLDFFVILAEINPDEFSQEVDLADAAVSKHIIALSEHYKNEEASLHEINQLLNLSERVEQDIIDDIRDNLVQAFFKFGTQFTKSNDSSILADIRSLARRLSLPMPQSIDEFRQQVWDQIKRTAEHIVYSIERVLPDNQVAHLTSKYKALVRRLQKLPEVKALNERVKAVEEKRAKTEMATMVQALKLLLAERQPNKNLVFDLIKKIADRKSVHINLGLENGINEVLLEGRDAIIEKIQEHAKALQDDPLSTYATEIPYLVFWRKALDTYIGKDQRCLTEILDELEALPIRPEKGDKPKTQPRTHPSFAVSLGHDSSEN